MADRPDRGAVATYIPELARVDPAHFGLAVVTRDGEVAAAGDCDVPFSVQSITKVFTLTLALGRIGDRLWRRVGREPSGNPFNSIVQLELERGIPRNPFINAGALAVTDAILSGHAPREALGEILRFMRFLAEDGSVAIDERVAASEKRTGFRNAALANFMASYGVLENPVDNLLGVYFHHCAIAMSCRQLAAAGRFLAFDGIHPGTGRAVVSPDRARRINAIMLTCGHYDGSGEFAYRVGLPGKSGVGGGILAVAPGRASICAWSPASTPPATRTSAPSPLSCWPSAWAGPCFEGGLGAPGSAAANGPGGSARSPRLQRRSSNRYQMQRKEGAFYAGALPLCFDVLQAAIDP